MNLEATQDNLVLRPIMASGISAGGVVIPGVRQFEDGCTVMSIGPLVEALVIGDIVVRPDPVRYTVTDDETGEILWLVAEADVLAKMLPDRKPITDLNRLLTGSADADTQDEKKEEEKETGSKEGEVHTERFSGGGLDLMQSLRPTTGLS